MYATVCTQGDFTWAEMRRKLSSHSAQVWLYITGGNTEKGVKQGKGSYLLLSMKKDQANKTNVEGVMRWQALAWEPGPDGSGVNPQLVREWVQHSCMSCASTHRSWSGVEAEEAEWRQRWWSGGGGSQRQLEVGGEGEGREWSGGGRSRVEAEEVEWRWRQLEVARGRQRGGREVIP